MFRIWIGNLGKYNEGELVGEWVDLPCDDFDAVFERIGINEYYEETFIADFENDYGYHVNEYENLDTLNEVAESLENLDDYERDVLIALFDNGYDYDGAMEVLINQNYSTWGGCDDMGDVARLIFEYDTQEVERVSPTLASYIDWDGIGHSLESGAFFFKTDDGYVEVW